MQIMLQINPLICILSVGPVRFSILDPKDCSQTLFTNTVHEHLPNKAFMNKQTLFKLACPPLRIQ